MSICLPAGTVNMETYVPSPDTFTDDEKEEKISEQSEVEFEGLWRSSDANFDSNITKERDKDVDVCSLSKENAILCNYQEKENALFSQLRNVEALLRGMEERLLDHQNDNFDLSRYQSDSCRSSFRLNIQNSEDTKSECSFKGDSLSTTSEENISPGYHSVSSIPVTNLGTSWVFASTNVSSFQPLSLISEEDIYNPSLPSIPIVDTEAGLGNLCAAQKGNNVNAPPGQSVLSKITSVSPALKEWYEAVSATSKLGWAVILYHAVRNHFKPRAFMRLAFQGSREYVRAVADYVTRESTLLGFKKGDIIRVTSLDRFGDSGWLQGSLDGRTGMFPVEYITPISRSEARYAAKVKQNKAEQHIDTGMVETESSIHTINTINTTQQPVAHVALSHSHHDDSGHSSGGEGVTSIGGMNGGINGMVPGVNGMANGVNGMVKGMVNGHGTIVHDGKHSLLQFALQHFRLSKEQGIIQSDGTLQTSTKSKKKKGGKDQQAEWTWKEQVEMVKFSQSPLQASLLPLEPELSQLAVENFVAVMRYMGDYPMAPQHTEVHCVYTIFMNCHKHLALRDEVYCQIMKQTTNNKSSIPDSCQRGWRLFCIVAAYFVCTDSLKPYLFKYLETAAYDKRRAYHGTAMVCLQNLRKTFKYGGRKNVPSIEEITAITAGRNSKRQIYRLPGGTERVINTKSTSVVQDIIEEMCQLISVRSPHEQEEYSLYCIVEGDTFTMPLAREEYILDVTTELHRNDQVFYLIFCRSVWYYPLRSDNALYYEVVFNQIAPDYLEGLLLVTPGEQLQQEIIVHHPPTKKISL